jgi:uncharacterized phage protein (TIGR01671 family)
MERIIKFRAWDGKCNKMFEVSGMHLKATHGIWSYDDTGKSHGFFKIMQFTGLLDSKGVEIYEKDIVLVENSLPEEKGEFDVTTICKWDNGFILEDNCGGHWTRQLLHEPERLTVIGNLFTHPELIK